MIEVESPITIRTKAGTVIITVMADGDIKIETFQQRGQAVYYLRDIIHPDGELKSY